MIEIINYEATTCELKDLVVKFIPELISKLIEKECNSIFPLSHVYIHKVKMLNAPKFDPHKLPEIYSFGATIVAKDTGVPIAQEGKHGETSSINAIIVQEEVIEL